MSHLPTRRAFFRGTAGAVAGAGCLLSGRGRSSAHSAEPEFRAKFAICNETFRDWPFDRAFALAAECGYRGIEVAPFTISDYVTDITARQRQQLRRQAERAGLEIVGLHWLLARTKGFHLTSPERDVRRKTTVYLGELARFCADLGGHMLVFGSPQQRNLKQRVSRARGLQYAAEVFRETLPVLEQTNVRLAMEPLSPRATNFVRTAAEAVELIKLVDSPRCGLILDCNAMSDETTPRPELIRRHQSRLFHFHANDPNSRGPGFGELDFVPLLQALREIDYRGWISVEVFDYQPGVERLARESIRYMQRCLAQVTSRAAS